MVFPDWTDNPYLNLLALEARARGHRVTGVTMARTLMSRAERLGAGDVLHVHWTSPILQKAETERDARAAFEEFRSLVQRLSDRGAHLVWTIHNRLPHELAHRELEVDLYRLLAEHAAVIHVMAPQTARVLEGITQLPEERVRVIPHPSFAGVYGVPESSDEARRRLGIDPARPTVLFLGQMRPYKGLNTLLDAMDVLAKEQGDSAPTLLLAGAADEETRIELEARMPRGLSVVSDYRFIDDAELPSWFGAADLAVFPYRAILNSGSVHLSAAFRVPCVVPGEDHLREMYADQPWVGFFDLEDPARSLAATIRSALAGTPVDRSEFDAFNESRTPWRTAVEYADAIDALPAGSRRRH